MRLVVKLALVLGALLSCQTMAATFTVPGFFDVIYVDDQKTKGLRKTYEVDVEPGQHQLLVRFSRKYKVGSDKEIIRSEPIIIDLNIPEGAQWSLQAEEPGNAHRAKKYAANPVFQITNQHGQPVDYQSQLLPKKQGSQLGRNYLEEVAVLKGKQSPAATVASEKPAEPPAFAAKNTELSMLKQWYNQADIQNRTAFKVWLADPNQALQNESTELEMLKFWYQKADNQTRKEFQIWMIQ